MNIKKIRKKSAASPIIGTLIILGIASSSFSVVYYSFSDNTNSTANYIVDISATMDNNTQVLITHHGGEPLNLDTQIYLRVGENSSIFTIGEYLDEQSKDDGVWSLGETVFYPLGYEYNYTGDPDLDIHIIV